MTVDLDSTRSFYESVLQFDVIALDTGPVEGGGIFRHLMLHIGRDQLLAFGEIRDVDGVPEQFDTSIHSTLGLPPGSYHIAFEAGTMEGLEGRRQALIDNDVPASDIYRNPWAASVYFRDPVNGLILEYCVFTREWNEADQTAQYPELPRALLLRGMSALIPGPDFVPSLQ